jgi:cholest-4-en-3-one 26-monooxygenase
MIRRLEGHVRSIGNELVDHVAGIGECDFVESISAELPLRVIVELVGVPLEDRHRVLRWSNEMLGYDDPEYQLDPATPQIAAAELFMYANELAAERMTNPRDDLASELMHAEIEGSRLAPEEFTSFFLLLLVAGNETTTNLIGNAAHALLAHRGALERVAREPERVPALVEEALRYDSPIQQIFRTSKQATELAGTRIPRGATVAVLLGSANRDERAFPDPDRFDVTREPRGHLAFGFGPHFCLGAALARLEARVALEGLVPELVRCKRSGERTAGIDSFLVRGRSHLDVVAESA